jgi:hypothetical protein
MLSPCMCIPPCQLLNASTNLYETWYVYHGNWANRIGVLHRPLPSVCVSVCVCFILLLRNGSVKCFLPFCARQLLDKHVPAATNTLNNRSIVGQVSFYAVHVLSKESLWVCLPIPLSLLGNVSVQNFPRQQRIVGIAFCAVRVVSKGSRLLVLPRTPCYLYFKPQDYEWLLLYFKVSLLGELGELPNKVK